MRIASLLLAGAFLAACSTSSDGPNEPPPPGDDAGADAAPPLDREVAVLPPLTEVKTTEIETLIPSHPVDPELRIPHNMTPEVRERQLREGYGEFTFGAGEAQIEESANGTTPPVAGPDRKRLLRFVHLADFQLADDESPSRLAIFDSAPPFESAARPQEGHECRIVNAVIRTINRLHKDAPLDFVVLGGDQTDSAQENEFDWVLGLMGGADQVVCDSGDPNDPVPGPNNDGKDPFKAEGLDVPWYWITGNHDLLNVGNLVIDEGKIAQSIGTTPAGGTRDYRLPGAPVNKEEMTPDPRRRPLTPSEVIDRIVGHVGRSGPPAHGLGEYAKTTKRAYFSTDLGDSGIRLIGLDTASQTGGSDGLIRKTDVDAFVIPELAQAKADGKWVIFASHHAAGSLNDGTGLGGTKQTDFVSKAEWEQLLTSNTHVLAHLAGHSHEHVVRRVRAAAPGTGGYWEIKTASIADYPHQFRVLEIWDEDNGQITFRSVAMNYATENDPVALEGRRLGILDYTTRGTTHGRSQPRDRNVILWANRPAD